MLRQPSRATSAPDESATTGSTSTSSPFDTVAFLCPVTSTTTMRTSSSICGAAMPTQCPNERIVSSRSPATRSTSAAPAGGLQVCLSLGSGTRRTSRTAMRG
jgi:hypothetical protein